MSDKKDKFLDFFKSYSDGEEALSDVKWAHSTIGEKVPAIHSGSYLLDDALGSNGIPSKLVQFYGRAGSGKTLMCMIAIVEAQKKNKTSRQLFIDCEGTFSTTWAKQIGIDLSRLIIVEGDMAVNGRKCFEMLLGVPKEDTKTHALKGKSKEGLLDKIINKELDINLCCLDSLGALQPPGEDISAVGKMNMSLLARFLTTTFRKLSLEINKAKIPFIIINHTKDNMDPYGSDHTFSGGNSYNHFLSANIFFEPVNRADAKILDEKEQKIGQTIRATVEKTKYGPWPRRVEYKVDFAKGIIDSHEEIAQLAIDYEVVEKPTTMSYIYGENKWVGYQKFCDAILESQDLRNQLLSKIDEVRENKRNKDLLEQKEANEKLDELEALKDLGLANEETASIKKSKSKSKSN